MNPNLRETGITDRQIVYWIRCGYIHPTDSSPGSGTQLQFSEEEIRIVKLMVKLTGVGFKPKQAAELARNAIEKNTPIVALGPDMVLVLDGRTGETEALPGLPRTNASIPNEREAWNPSGPERDKVGQG